MTASETPALDSETILIDSNCGQMDRRPRDGENHGEPQRGQEGAHFSETLQRAGQCRPPETPEILTPDRTRVGTHSREMDTSWCQGTGKLSPYSHLGTAGRRLAGHGPCLF